ncbi:unnamed protein product [Urochloa humidicola]
MRTVVVRPKCAPCRRAAPSPIKKSHGRFLPPHLPRPRQLLQRALRPRRSCARCRRRRWPQRSRRPSDEAPPCPTAGPQRAPRPAGPHSPSLSFPFFSSQNKTKNQAETARRPNPPATLHLRPIPLTHGTPTSPAPSMTKPWAEPSFHTVGIADLVAVVAVRPSSAGSIPQDSGHLHP